jgi:hypothetical protein
MIPKRGEDVNKNEISRFYRITNSNKCEVISAIVPRTSKGVLEDLYPNTLGLVPALSAEALFTGEDGILVSMRPDSQFSTNKQDLKPPFFSTPWSSLQQPVDVKFHAASGSVQLGNSSGNNTPCSLNVHQSRNSNKPPFLSSPLLR